MSTGRVTVGWHPRSAIERGSAGKCREWRVGKVCEIGTSKAATREETAELGTTRLTTSNLPSNGKFLVIQ